MDLLMRALVILTEQTNPQPNNEQLQKRRAEEAAAGRRIMSDFKQRARSARQADAEAEQAVKRQKKRKAITQAYGMEG